MGLFDSLFGKKNQKDSVNNATANKQPTKTMSTSTPEIHFIHTNQNSDMVIDPDNNVLVLWWISKKKKGYDKTSNKYPKWFEQKYGIDFNRTMESYIAEGCLSSDGDMVVITESGSDKLKEYDYVVYIYEHAQYALTLDDFRKAANLHKVQNSDIVWGVFNNRILSYTQKGMWESLAANHGNMADLLINEKRYNDALEHVFAAAYIETSGMRDGNELTPIMGVAGKKSSLPNGMPDIFLLEINNYYVTVPFAEAQKNLNLDWDEIRRRFTESKLVGSLESTLPFKYFEKEESYEIFKEAVLAGGSKGIFPLKDVSKKLKYNTPDEHSRRYFYASAENKVNRKFGK